MIKQDNKLGFGLGLRNKHFDYIINERPKVDFFEAISENFMDSGGRPRWALHKITEHYPVVLHGVSLSIGSTDPLNMEYLSKLKRLADETHAAWVSDHLCWTGINGLNSHDLLPLPLNEQVLEHLIPRIQKVQEYLQRPLVLENPSTYIQFKESSMDEPEFLDALSKRTGCQLLLDVNNIYVSCFNAGLNPLEQLHKYPFDRVVQMHLAGHQHCGTHIVDTHDQPVCDEVWALFGIAWDKTQGAATLLEWDGNIPEFPVLQAEILKAKKWLNGEAKPGKKSTPQDATHAISNPVDFLVSNDIA